MKVNVFYIFCVWREEAGKTQFNQIPGEVRKPWRESSQQTAAAVLRYK